MHIPYNQPEQRAIIQTLQEKAGQEWAAFHEDPALNAYLVIERAMSPELTRLAKRQLQARAHAVLFEHTPEAHLAELSPWLIALPSLPEPAVLTPVCTAAQLYGGMVWLWSALDLPALAEHLRKFMGATLYNEATGEIEGDIALRSTDPRVLPGFIEALHPHQRDAFLQPIRACAIWNRHLQWQRWDGPAEPVTEPLPPLHISLGQLGVMNRHTQPDKILHLLETEYGQQNDSPVHLHLLSQTQDARYRAVCACTETARRIGYENDQDLALFASLTYLCHPRFSEAPRFRQAMQDGIRNKISLANTVIALPDAAWEEIDRMHATEFNAADSRPLHAPTLIERHG